MARTKEWAVDPLSKWGRGGDSHLDAKNAIQMAHRPRDEDDLVSLMEAPPHHNPAPSQDSLYPLRCTIDDEIEHGLTERERFIFNSICVERISFRALGVRMSLGKSFLHREYHSICEKLAASLQYKPDIAAHLASKN